MSALLEIVDLVAGYGEAVVLDRLSLTLDRGRSLALLGRNGTGKTTTIDTIVGVTRRFSGKILLDGVDVSTYAPEKRAAAGIGWVPQERNIFRSLTVEENITAVARKGPWDLTRLYAMFPRLRERRANMGNQLSGGEQQMLAVARALALNPKILLADEPLEGLAPIIVDELLAAFRRISREDGLSVVLVEQQPRKILAVTDDAVVLERGTVVLSAPSAELIADPARLDRFLAVAHG